jgi:phosphoadenosine phosphosulfate reductase
MQTPSAILKWGITQFYPRIAIASSFSIDDTVVIDLATKIQPNIEVIYINTGHQFPETDAIKEIVKQRYHLNLIEYSAPLSLEEQTQRYGVQLYVHNPDLCCKVRKVEPFKRALTKVDAWITGLRREQSVTRRNLQVIEHESTETGQQLIKLNPLASWSRQDVWDYIRTYDLPYNSLYDSGFMSIGCSVCTRRVQNGEDERAGRWAGTGKLECGIHTFLKNTEGE